MRIFVCMYIAYIDLGYISPAMKTKPSDNDGFWHADVANQM